MVGGCSGGAHEECNPVTVVVDASPVDAGDADPCRCAFHWSRGPEPIVCYTRGDCVPTASCEPVLPLTEEPACQFR